MADIFISYARADRDRIEKLASALEGEGYSVWWDRRIQSGSEFSKDIEAELNAAKAVVVCWSKSANDSRWVKDEANAGAEAGKLMTVTIDGSLPPIGFRQFHCADLSKWHGKTEEAAFADFNSAVNARVTGEPATISAFPSKPGGAHALSGVHPSIPIVAIVAAAIVAIVWFGVSSETGKEAVQHALEEQTGLTAPPRIAVTPINVAGDVAALSGMAETLREDIASGLSRFSLIDVAALAQSDAASYQLDATLRQTGDDLRLTARLIDIDSGRQVWGETFDRNIAGKSAFEIQDDLKDHLVASVADPYGALMRDLQAPVARKNAENLTPFEAVLRHSIYRQRLSAEDHVIARAALERAAEKAPNNADVFASLAAVTIEEIKHDYNWKPDADKRALNAARRAVELDPDNAYAWFELAEVQYFLGDLGAFRSAAERAIELNPRDTESLAMLGILTGYAGDWDRGRELTTRAMALNPNHPGWYRFNVFFDAYRQGNYNEALQIAERIRQPDYFADAYARAIAHAQLGQIQAAERAAQKFISLLPDGFETWREKHLEVWMYAQPALQEQIIEGLEKAGLKIDGGPLEATSAPDQSIAVLPFDALSNDASDDYFGKGLAEELLNALAKFPELKVAARTSAFSFQDKDIDIRDIAQQLGVAHVLEGSVRRSGDRLRVTAQLIRAEDGFHLWSNTYEKKSADVFAIEDEIVRDISRSLEVRLGIGAGAGRASGEGVNQQAYEQYLKGLTFWGERDRGPDQRLNALKAFQNATAFDPKFADAWAAIGTVGSYSYPFNVKMGAEEYHIMTETAFNEALSLDPDNAAAHAGLVPWRLGKPDIVAAQTHMERALEIAPNRADSHYTAATYWMVVGDTERAAAAYERAISLDPLNMMMRRVRSNFLSSVGRFDEAFVFNDECLETRCLGEGFPVYVFFQALNSGNEDRITKWYQYYKKEEAFLETWPVEKRPPPILAIPAAVSIRLSRPDAESRINTVQTLLNDKPISQDLGLWAPTVARHLPVSMMLDSIENAMDRGEFIKSAQNMPPFYGVDPWPEEILRHPRYHALWARSGMAELAAARRANGWEDGLPLPIIAEEQ